MSDSDPEEHDKLMAQNQDHGDPGGRTAPDGLTGTTGEDEEEADQDAEPTMTAPDGERPTGHRA